jgi:hypothetical protein
MTAKKKEAAAIRLRALDLPPRMLADVIDHAVTYYALDLPPAARRGGDKERLPRRVSAGPAGVVVDYHRSVGRPSRERLGILVNLLALTWEAHHRKFPGRAYRRRDEVRERPAAEDGPFVRFVRACLAAIDPAADYPSALVRRVILGRKIHDARAKRQRRAK